MEKTNQTESWISKNKVNLGVAIGVLISLGAGIAYWGYRRGRYPDMPEINTKIETALPKAFQEATNANISTNNSSIGPVASQKPQYINKIRTLRDKVAAETRRGELDMNTIVLIHEALMDISEEAFGNSILQNRIQRR